MKKIDYHLEGYSVEVNNCLNYNLAGAVSYYNKKFLKIYCAFWGLYSNWIFKNNEEIIKDEILKKIGLQSCVVKKINKFNFLNKICNLIKEGKPVLLYVSSSTIYYLNSYKKKINFINHSIIIDEFDKKYKLCHIRENSINKEMITMLTSVQPFSDYTIPLNQLKKFYKENLKLFGRGYKNNCLEFIKKIENKSLENICLSFVEDFNNFFKKENDILLDLLNQIENSNFINDTIYNEQIHRTIIHSMKPMFDFLGDCYNLNNDDYLNTINEFISSRNIIIKNLCKQKQKGDYVDINKIKELKEKMILCYENISHVMLKASYSCNFDLMRNYVKNIYCDSENYLFPVINLLNTDDYSVEKSVWKSDNKTEEHWLVIEFMSKCLITNIIIEHGHYEKTITNSFSVWYYSNDNHWEMLDLIENNHLVITHTKCNNVITDKIKILIDIPNTEYNFVAILRRIQILGEKYER